MLPLTLTLSRWDREGDDRLAPHGYGQERPLVPNVTAGNRARNRRVQFIILEKGDAAPAPGAAPTERKKNPLPGF